jgi:hypothetical protein
MSSPVLVSSFNFSGNENESINTNNQYCMINKITLHDVNILLASEIDAVKGPTQATTTQNTNITMTISMSESEKQTEKNNNATCNSNSIRSSNSSNSNNNSNSNSSSSEIMNRLIEPQSVAVRLDSAESVLAPPKRKGPPPRRDAKRAPEQQDTRESSDSESVRKKLKPNGASAVVTHEVADWHGCVELKTAKEIENDDRATSNFERYAFCWFRFVC